MISKISSTCFGQTFAHLQERKTVIFTAYGIVSCCCGRQGFGQPQRALRVRYELPSYRTRSAMWRLSEPLPTTTGHCTICCKILSLTLLKMGKRLPETCWADLGDQWIVIVASSRFFCITLPTETWLLNTRQVRGTVFML